MIPYDTDAELFRLLKKELFTAVVGDVMDRLGFRRQFLPAALSPLRADMKVAGRAMPVLVADLSKERFEVPADQLAEKPFGLMLEALDDLNPGEIYLATGTSLPYALWGELMSTRAIYLKAAGAVLDGCVRDAAGIEALDFPTFCRGLYAQDQALRGKVVDYRSPVEIDGVRIEPGALMFGDREGVLVVPRAAEEEVVRLSLEKVHDENLVAEAIRGGMSTVEAFEKYRVM